MKPVDLAIGAAVCAMIGAGIGIVLFVRQAPEGATVQAPVFSAPPPPTMTQGPSAPMRAAQTQIAIRVAVGGHYTLASLDRLWVNRLGMDAWNRAEDDRDKKSQDRISDAFENFFVDAGTRVAVIVSDGKVKQLQVLSGKYAERRGWTDTYSDSQYIP